MNQTSISILRLSLEGMSNDILASASNGLAGFQNISKRNMAYQPFLDANLINEDGTAIEYENMLDALDAEISSRMAAGTFA